MLTAQASYVGERIDTRGFAESRRVGHRPLSIRLAGGGVAVLFRYGAIVLFDSRPGELEGLLEELGGRVEQHYARPETESATLRIDPQAEEGIDESSISLRSDDLPRLQMVASVLGKTVALAQYEADVAASIERVEPFAEELERTGRGGRNLRELLRHIGRGLRDEHKLIGRVEVMEKPDLLWDHPELEPLHNKLENEYELRERAAMLDRKLQLNARTVSTVLDLLQQRRSLRVEWYIIALIVVEIVLSVYDLFLR